MLPNLGRLFFLKDFSFYFGGIFFNCAEKHINNQLCLNLLFIFNILFKTKKFTSTFLKLYAKDRKIQLKILGMSDVSQGICYPGIFIIFVLFTGRPIALNTN